MPSAIHTAPRIYYLYPELAGAPDALLAHLGRCRTMGFTHIMIAAVARREPEATPTAQRDPAGGSNRMVTAVAEACKAQGLALILDIDINAGLQAPLHPLRTGNAAVDTSAPPDPRRLQAIEPAIIADGRADVLFWNAMLQQWLDAGAAGFCCRSLASRSRAFWQSLIADVKQHQPGAIVIGWTPGCTPAQLGALIGCGFDATIASTAWWDCRAAWFTEEAGRLAQVAPPIALVDDPLAPIMQHRTATDDANAVHIRCERTLRLAAVSACGTLMPMGFEFGLSAMRDPDTGERHDLTSALALIPSDLSATVSDANALLASLEGHPSWAASTALVSLTTSQAGVSVLMRRPCSAAGEAILIVTNANIRTAASVELDSHTSQMAGLIPQERLWPAAVSATVATTMSATAATTSDEATGVLLQPGALQLYAARPLAPIVSFINRGKRPADAACRAPRIAIEAITPAVDHGTFPVKRTVGDRVEVEADVFMDGHDKLGVVLLWRGADIASWTEVPMTALGNDRWRAILPLQRAGRHLFAVLAWRDAFATYRDELGKKASVGLDLRLELEEGRRLIDAGATHAAATGHEASAATLAALGRLLVPTTPVKAGGKGGWSLQKQPQLVAAILCDTTARAMQHGDDRQFSVLSEPVLSIDAERLAARFSSWYELFPRSQSGDVSRHGTFTDVEARLPAIAAMGFDTLYFPPIHPIGKRNRKGPNNSLTPTATDPGSPYAIGAEHGGHDAIHPELGTLAEFRHLCSTAKAHGLEIALDFAIQCSPDHPWIKDHPEWFAWRPDGSMRYAENPPKKYEDIVNVDFYAEGAAPALWIALRNAVLFWVNEGVRVFRVDNPHTKPLPFWQWMIGDIRSRHPDVIFLSEAFTRPKVMYRLAKVGFSQSYSYFTWRHSKAEFTDYLTELSTTAVRDYFRPHFFVNTPDINPEFLQKSGRPGFLIRAALATTLSGLWGMYSGFELCEATPVPGKEDYLDSEKYQLRAWDWQRPGNIIAEITDLNRIRRANPALQSHLGIQFLEASDPSILCFIKFVPQPAGSSRLGDDAVFVAINLDPFAAHQTTFSLPLWQLGVPDDGLLAVEDLVHGNRFTLQGKPQQLRLDPSGLPYAIWRLQAPGGAT